jgi:hypothetical protein
MLVVMSSARRRGWSALLGGAALLVVGGCSLHRPPAPAVPAASPGAMSATSTFDPADPVQAFLGWEHALDTARGTLSPGYPGLTVYGQGPALAAARSSIARFTAQGIRPGKPTIVMGARVTGRSVVKGRQVREVTACVIEQANDFVDVRTGQPRAPAGSDRSKPVYSKYVAVLVQGDDGGWRLDRGPLTDVPSCASVR